MLNRRLILFILMTCPALAQPAADSSKPIFRMDGVNPKEGSAAELLEAVCPGNVIAGSHIMCGGVCPKFTGASGEHSDLEAVRVTRGHFLSPVSEDALLSTSGCETHVNNSGASVLLTRESGAWKRIWYKSGVITRNCHKLALPESRESLVCEDSYGAQGHVWRYLYVEDLKSPRNHTQDFGFFSVKDTMLACGGYWTGVVEPVAHAVIERVEFHGSNLSVFARYGKMNFTRDQERACADDKNAQKPAPPTEAYKIDFVFDGKTFRVTPETSAAARAISR